MLPAGRKSVALKLLTRDLKLIDAALSLPQQAATDEGVSDLVRRLDWPSDKALRVELIATMREAGQFIRDLLSTPTAQQAATNEGEGGGFVLMPRRATRGMVEAADSCTDAYAAYSAMVEAGHVR